ncbi:hypothetical protein HDE_10825 [Halotydeus destructor]|nr:hypothetical protein HDE_10825 [Halotydeus destructor]
MVTAKMIFLLLITFLFQSVTAIPTVRCKYRSYDGWSAVCLCEDGYKETDGLCVKKDTCNAKDDCEILGYNYICLDGRCWSGMIELQSATIVSVVDDDLGQWKLEVEPPRKNEILVDRVFQIITVLSMQLIIITVLVVKYKSRRDDSHLNQALITQPAVASETDLPETMADTVEVAFSSPSSPALEEDDPPTYCSALTIPNPRGLATINRGFEEEQ